VRLGETERAERTLAELGEQDREPGELRIAKAVLRLAPARARPLVRVGRGAARRCRR
jgi:hypothetical protein